MKESDAEHRLLLLGFGEVYSMSVVFMSNIPVRFVISKLSEADVEALKVDRAIMTKMILSVDDYELFRYKVGDSIEVETEHGNRLWSTIFHLEIVNDNERVILMFTLIKDSRNH